MSTNRDTTSQSDIRKQPIEKDGSFKRPDSQFRNWIEKSGKFAPEAGRYHLFVAYVCPWATRTLIVRKLKGLEDIIGVTVASSRLDEHGWPFAKIDKFPDVEDDPFYGSEHIKDLYLRVDPDYTGRFTVPILWDKKLETIVNNESSEIIRMLNSAFNELLPADKAALDLYPVHLREEIDSVNDWVYHTVNNGVYKTGFSKTQAAYEASVIPLFESLDRLEKMLTGQEYLIGGQLTEADVRLFVTIIRFDVAYYGVFKCNIRDIHHGYPAIHKWMKKLYWTEPAFKSTTYFDHIKGGYYSNPSVNPTKVVPVGPLPPIEPL
ncbi:hypothetical protein NEOLEDRAFT_1157009 [Neolentinus lepideus HHB14362 ss-1]|uniref:GST C-terminal domain-containing protein n=1 Tax=Neolentinus lepideus HHB14362 ss-1 TaxID=1314782 RepID=A0A165RNZ0_9AGAM|nr:hypothetical protein NEOLEDRAFT_1157009 [Neolentinus lepideus HHB14362 ss-1]